MALNYFQICVPLNLLERSRRAILRNLASFSGLIWTRANELAARVPKTARGIHCCSKLFYFFPRPTSQYCEKCVYIHISECVENVYELPLQPNNTASAIFLHKSGAVRSVNWIFITGAPAWR